MNVVAIHTLFKRKKKNLSLVYSVPVTDLEPVTFPPETSGTTLGNDLCLSPSAFAAPGAVHPVSILIMCFSSFTKRHHHPLLLFNHFLHLKSAEASLKKCPVVFMRAGMCLVQKIYLPCGAFEIITLICALLNSVLC